MRIADYGLRIVEVVRGFCRRQVGSRREGEGFAGGFERRVGRGDGWRRVAGDDLHFFFEHAFAPFFFAVAKNDRQNR